MKDLLSNQMSEVSEQDLPRVIGRNGVNSPGRASRRQQVSPDDDTVLPRAIRLTQVERDELVNGYQLLSDHHLVDTKEKEKDGESTRKRRAYCEVCRGKETTWNKRARTKMVCSECKAYICSQECMAEHHIQVMRKKCLEKFG